VKIISFDVWNTLIKYDRKLREEISQNITNYLISIGYEVNYEHVLDIFNSVDREIRTLRIDYLQYIPPEHSVTLLLNRLAKRYNINVNDDLIFKVLEVISSTIINSKIIRLADNVQEVLSILKSEDYTIATFSNVVFWHGKTTRQLLSKLGIDKYIDYQVYADEIGYVKPHPQAFSKLYEKITRGLIPEVAIHVGDSLREDFTGALMSNVIAVLLDEEGRYVKSQEPVEIIKCRGFIIRRLKDVILIPHMISRCLG